MTAVSPPPRVPCPTCPYRRDTPPGIWEAAEYDKLPHYDRETWAQPSSLFMCHQADGRLCGGWVAVHDMAESLALRFAVIDGTISPDDFARILDYAPGVPLYSSGAEAAAAGKAGLHGRLSPAASAAIDKLTRVRAARAH